MHEILVPDISRYFIYDRSACLVDVRTIGQGSVTLLSVPSAAGVDPSTDVAVERTGAELDVGVRILPPSPRRRPTSVGALLSVCRVLVRVQVLHATS